MSSIKEEALAAVKSLGPVSPVAAAAYALGYVAGKDYAVDSSYTMVDATDVPNGESRVGAVPAEGPVTVVLGNESADMDSIVSARIWARHLGAIPVINCCRDDYPLRRDVVKVFETAEIDPAELVFIEEIELDELSKAGRLSLVLVDHCMLSESQAELGPSVTAVVDHHKDEGLYLEANPREVDLVGSCCTLLARRILASPKASELTTVEAVLMLGTILENTINLDLSKGRGKPVDVEMAEKLAQIAGVPFGNGPGGTTALHDEITAAKRDVGPLTAVQLLRRDTKFYALDGELSAAIAAVPIPLSELFAKPDAAESVTQTCAKYGLDVLVVMSAFVDDEGTFTRELCLYMPEAAGRAAHFASLRDHLLSGPMGLAAAAPAGLWPTAVAYTQENVKPSRKVVAPLLLAYTAAK